MAGGLRAIAESKLAGHKPYVYVNVKYFIEGGRGSECGNGPGPPALWSLFPLRRLHAPLPASGPFPDDRSGPAGRRGFGRRAAGVGTAPLRWDHALAAEAGVWARELLDTGLWGHDPARHGHGENLWSGWGDRIWTPEEMVGEWTAEKRLYVRGVFPNVSRTGDWTAVGHYTQMVWSETTHVGCAIAARGNRSVLACRYSPPGNIRGSRAF